MFRFRNYSGKTLYVSESAKVHSLTMSRHAGGSSEAGSSDKEKMLLIKQLVARSFGLEASGMDKGSQERVNTIPRQIGMYLSKYETGASLAEIGSVFGGMHHTTVMHAIARITHLRRTDSATDLAITILQKNLKSGAPPPIS